MKQERLKAYTELEETTFVTRETTEPGDTLLDGTPKPPGVVTLYGPNNEQLKHDADDWYSEVSGGSKFRVPDANAS